MSKFKDEVNRRNPGNVRVIILSESVHKGVNINEPICKLDGGQRGIGIIRYIEDNKILVSNLSVDVCAGDFLLIGGYRYEINATHLHKYAYAF